MSCAFNMSRRRSKTELRSGANPFSSKILTKRSPLLNLIIKHYSEFIASLLNETKQLTTLYKTAKKYPKFTSYKPAGINTSQLSLQDIPKTRVEIFYNKLSRKVFILVNSKSICSIKASKNSISYKRALK